MASRTAKMHKKVSPSAKAPVASQKQWRKGTNQGNLTQITCLLEKKIVGLHWEFSYAWKMIWGDLTSDERADNGSGPR